MRLPDGSFAFYDLYHPQAGPLVLPDGEGRKHTLLPPLPDELVESEAIIESGVLANTQVILTAAVPNCLQGHLCSADVDPHCCQFLRQ